MPRTFERASPPVRASSLGALCGALLATFGHPAASPGYDWQSVGPEGGRLDGFAQAASDPNRLYALPQSLGVLRSDDRGDTWSRVDTGLGMDVRYRRLAVSPADADVLLLGEPASNRVLRSTDGGMTWTSCPVGAAWSSLVDVGFDPHDPSVVLLAATESTGPELHRSTDGGSTWVALDAGFVGLYAGPIAFHPTIPGVVLAGTGDGVYTTADAIYRSTDSGQQWTLLNSAGSGDVLSLDFSRADPAIVWATRDATLLRSTDAGSTFAPPPSQPIGSPMQDLFGPVATHPADPGTLLLAISHYEGSGFGPIWSRTNLWRTTNGGASWSLRHTTPLELGSEAVVDLAYDPDFPTRAYAAIGGGDDLRPVGLLRSQDSGASFAVWMNGIRCTGVLAMGRGPTGSLHVCGPPNQWYRADALNAGWTTGGGVPYTVTAYSVNPSIAGLVEQAGGVLSFDWFDGRYSRSTNGGISWSTDDLPAIGPSAEPTVVFSDRQDGQRVYVWGTWQLVRSDDGGSSFQSPVEPGFVAADAVIAAGERDRFFVVDRDMGAVKLTADAGVTWTVRAAGLPTSTPRRLFMGPTFLPGGQSHLLVVYATAGVYESTDDGLNWVTAAGPLPGVIAAAWDPAGHRVFLVTSTSVRTGNGGTLEAGLPTRRLTSALWLPGDHTLLVGTHHAGIQALDIPAQVVDATLAIGGEPGLSLRVFPTPTRGAADIELTVPAGRPVDLAVYSVDGRRVATLLRGVAAHDRQLVRWDGVKSTAGIYFVRLSDGQKTVTERVVRLK